jgi:hypothetical protein
VIGLCATAALADPNHSDPKPWSIYLGERTTFPEQEPNDTCPGQQMSCGDVVSPAYLDAGNLDWYTWNSNSGDQITCGTDAVNPGDNTDTYIELYANDCSTLLASDDDSGPDFYSLISNFIAPYTGQYNLKVRGFSGSSSGPYKFFVTCGTPPPPPANDLCSGAIPIDRCTAGSLSGDTTPAHNDYDPGIPGPSCTGYPEAGKDVVYSVNLQAGDIVDMTYLQQTADTAFYIVTDCSNVSGSCVAGADATVPPDPETIHYVATADGTYYIILDAYGTDAGGPWTLDYNFQCPGPEACCFTDGHCEMQTEAVCRRMGGTPQGTGTTCDPNPCHPVASQPSTWGQIKTSYR